jgi:putative chitinase
MSLASLQAKIGVTADGVFGKGTLKAAMAYYKLTPVQAAHFFAQTAHESGNFKAFSENLNYSAEGLLRIFPRYFDQATANKYARQPERIANRVYASRMGNGDEASGDGFKYKGRGALQLTGKSNYNDFAKWLGKTIDPNAVADEYAFESAKYFFDKNKLWAICDKGVDDATILALSARINGSKNPHGLADRNAKTKLYYSWLT